MKTIKFFFQILSAVAFVILINPAEITAQNIAVSSDTKNSPSKCDVDTNTKTMLQRKANGECASIPYTVWCTDEATGSEVVETYIFQPDPGSPDCDATVIITDDLQNGAKSRGATTFSVTVLREQCAGGGVTLTAYVPGNDNILGQNPYKFSWVADGKEIDADLRAECVKENVTLKVTKKATYEVVTKNISIAEVEVMSRGGGIKIASDGGVATMDSDQAITYCDQLISDTKYALQERANKNCRTTKVTVACKDRRSGVDVHVVLQAQPAHGVCATTIRVTDITANQVQSRGGAADFAVEVMQDNCPHGGVTLSAYVPGEDNLGNSATYDFKWMKADDKVFDSDRKAECVTNEKTILVVTKTETGQTVAKSITLDQVVSRGASDYKVIGFESTAVSSVSDPVFKAAINNSGKATWTGIANVERMGTWEAAVDANMLKAIKEKADQIDYFNLYSKYPTEGRVADASSTITYLRDGYKEKTVINTFDSPDALNEYEEMLAKMISTLNWRKVANANDSLRN